MDKRAKNILFQTYWKNGCWVDDKAQTTNQEDFLYAKEKEVMFDPLTISHDDCVARIIELIPQITQDEVIRTFLSSLSTRRLELRSGIASWFIAQQFTPHTYTPVVSGHSYENGAIVSTSYTCGVCKNLMYGIIGDEYYQNADLNVLNFERIKWGGVRHGDLLYTLFDLERFKKEDIQEPTNEDISIFCNILKAIDDSDTGDYSSKLRERLKTVPGLKSNKSELDNLMEILACIGVLKPSSYERPTRSKHDWVYMEYWRGEDKYDRKTVKRFFGKYLNSAQR